MALQPCALLRSCALPVERFASVGDLAARIHQLREGRPIFMRRMCLSPVGACVVIRWADDAHQDGPDLGYAVVGDPPRPGAVQYDLLGLQLSLEEEDPFQGRGDPLHDNPLGILDGAA